MERSVGVIFIKNPDKTGLFDFFQAFDIFYVKHKNICVVWGGFSLSDFKLIWRIQQEEDYYVGYQKLKIYYKGSKNPTKISPKNVAT